MSDDVTTTDAPAAPSSALARLRRDDRFGVVAAALVMGATLLAFVVFGRDDIPLSVFAVGPLVAGAVAGPVVTAAVGVLAAIVAVGLGAGDDTLPRSKLVVFAFVMVFIGLICTAAAEYRRRRERMIRDAGRRVSLLSTLESGLISTPVAPPTFRVVTRYRAGDDRMQIGGDFLDVTTTPEGHLAFVVGDVAGHGAAEAALGTGLRAGWRALAQNLPPDPALWLRGLDRAFFAEPDPSFTFVTVAAGVIRGDDGTLLLASAGHPPPILLGARPVLLELDAGPALGVLRDGHATWRTHTLTLSSPWGLMLYTDGLFETFRARGMRERLGIDGLLRHLDRVDRPWQLDAAGVDALVAEIAEQAGEDFADDVAIVVIGDVGDACWSEP